MHQATSNAQELQGLCSVVCFIAGEKAEQLSAGSMSHEAMVDAALQQLDTIFGDRGSEHPASTTLVKSRVVDWAKEEYVQGAYSVRQHSV